MSIKMRLSLVATFFIAIILAISYVGYKGASTLTQSMERITSVQMPSARNMGLLDMVHDGLASLVYRSLYVSSQKDEAEKKDLLPEIEEFSNNFKLYHENLSKIDLPKETQKVLKDSEPDIDSYRKQAIELTTLALSFKDNDRAEAQKLLVNFNKTFKILEVKLDELGTLIERDAELINTDGKESAKEIFLMSLFGVSVGLILSVLMVILISKNLSSIFFRINTVSTELSRASNELSTTSQQLAAASQEQASSIEETSSSLEEITGMVSSSLKSAENSVQLSKKVSSLVTDGNKSMMELQEAVQQIKDANTRVEQLGELIAEIGEKTELIDEIVFQTRLLSFNASVEAERAGEHGRGFAVVAQEVGNLAQMSGKSAAEIVLIVKKSIKEAQEVVQLSKIKTDQGFQLCKATANQLLNIESASVDILNGAEQILRSSVEQNTGISQINQSIQMLSRTTQENTAMSQTVAENSHTLTTQNVDLMNALGSLELLTTGHQKETNEKSGDSLSSSNVESKIVAFPNKKPRSNFDKFKSFDAHPSKQNQGSLALSSTEDPWEKL